MAKLGEMLIKEGLLTQEQLQEALEIQKSSPQYLLGDILVRRGIIKEQQLVDVMVRQSGCRSVNVERLEIDPDLKMLIPENVAKQHHCLPVKRNQNLLYVAMVDPGNSNAINTLSSVSSCIIKTFVIGPTDLENGWKRLYGNEASSPAGVQAQPARSQAARLMGGGVASPVDSKTVDAVMQSAVEDVQEIQPDETDGPQREDILKIEAEERSPIIRLVNSLLYKAVQMNASDIHIEPFEDIVRVRFRIDGVMIKIVNFPVSAAQGVVSRIKVISQMDIAEKRIPQDGRMKAKFSDDLVVDIRVNTLPGVHGEKVVLRILGQGELLGEISQLGLRGESFSLLTQAIKNPYGMILVTGPTGSGKTTTLYTILQQLNRENINVVTAEDPVEFRLKGITQVNIRPAIGFSFHMALRAFLRQDPDIILVGEMRDYETGAIAVRAALTGHLVLSTLHTNDCPSSVVRLVDMGIEPFMVAAAVKLVIAQRLVRRICEHCKEEIPVSEAERMEVDESVLSSIERLFRGKGCKHCNDIGYKGRAPVFEVMPVKSQEMKRIITEGGTEVQVGQVARREALRTLRDDALEMVNNGITTLEESLSIIMVE
jgi:type IV pilus assembly protein PilB